MMILEYYKNKTINNSTLFLLPLVGRVLDLTCNKKSFLQFISERGFLNSFIKDVSQEAYTTCIFLVFDTTHEKYYTPCVQLINGKEVCMHDFIISKSSCLDYYEIDSKIVYILSLDAFKNDYELIIQGKYSSISNEIKKIYQSFMKLRYPDYHIIYIQMVINKLFTLNDLFYNTFGSEYQTDYHDLFDERLDYINLNDLKSINFTKSNNLFNDIVLAQNKFKK